jgi:hypothetical protein
MEDITDIKPINKSKKGYVEKWRQPSFARNSFLNLDTFKSCDLIGYKDSQ